MNWNKKGSHFFRSAAAVVLSVLVFFASAAAGAETYTSGNSNYPSRFDNPYKSHYYDTVQLDAVNFAGREIVFFTMNSDKRKALYYYTPGFTDPHAGISIGITNPGEISLMTFKTVVFNNVLYMFYTAPGTSGPTVYRGDTIYYRTATVDYGSDGTGWNLIFSEQKSLPAGISRAGVCFATVMNGKLYVIYSLTYLSTTTYGNNWYYISSADGLTFDQGKPLFGAGPGTYPESWLYASASGEVFTVPDATEGFKEKMIIAYSTGGSSIYYFFFDGLSQGYGQGSVQTGLSNVTSVRMIAGTAEGYGDDEYAIQVFCTTPVGTSTTWSYIYHGEYIPSGANGASGHWSTTWTRLSQSDSDQAYGAAHWPAWAIIPVFTNDGTTEDLQMNLHLWYSRGSDYTYKPFGQSDQAVKFRYSGYKSDYLKHADDTPIPPPADLTTSTVLGVIEGTPPYPVNNGVPSADSAGISTVELSTQSTYSFSTTWTASAGAAVSYGRKFGPVGMQAKITAGVKHTKESAKEKKITRTDTLKSYNYTGYPGGLGWVIFLQPDLKTDEYIMQSYNRTPLAYDGDTDELRIMVITYGPDTSLGKKAFYLDKPSECIGGTDCSTRIFAGMAPRPLSSDFLSWTSPVLNTDTYTILNYAALPAFQSTQGALTTTQYVETVTDAVTNGFNAGFSTSASAFGFTAEGNVNFSMDVKTTTSMQQSLGFHYAVPPCGAPGSTTSCISDVTVIPYLLIPKEDRNGYNAPWIYNDIRNYQKPKPWSLTYYVKPSNAPTATALAATAIVIEKIQGTLLIDQKKPNRDKLSATISLVVPPTFLMNRDDWVSLRLGNHFTDSNGLEVISRTYDGKTLVLQLRGADPDSSITIKLSYDAAKSLLDIALDADRVDLKGLRAYRFLSALDQPSVIKGNTLPLGLYLGGRYFAKGEVDILCTLNEQNAACNFHGNE